MVVLLQQLLQVTPRLLQLPRMRKAQQQGSDPLQLVNDETIRFLTPFNKSKKQQRMTCFYDERSDCLIVVERQALAHLVQIQVNCVNQRTVAFLQVSALPMPLLLLLRCWATVEQL